jgi:hypothetical protein
MKDYSKARSAVVIPSFGRSSMDCRVDKVQEVLRGVNAGAEPGSPKILICGPDEEVEAYAALPEVVDWVIIKKYPGMKGVGWSRSIGTAWALRLAPDLTHVVTIDDTVAFNPEIIQDLLGICRRHPEYAVMAAWGGGYARWNPGVTIGDVIDIGNVGVFHANSAEAFRRLGGYRLEYRADLDWCIRARAAGYKTGMGRTRTVFSSMAYSAKKGGTDSTGERGTDRKHKLLQANKILESHFPFGKTTTAGAFVWARGFEKLPEADRARYAYHSPLPPAADEYVVRRP